MSLDFCGLKSNLAELCSASKAETLVPSVTGKSLFNASRGWGALHRGFFVLCSYSGKEPPLNPLLKRAFRYTADQYEAASKVAKAWLEDAKARKETKENDVEVVSFLASFHKTCLNPAVLNRLQALFQSQGVSFNLIFIPNIDFYRRLDCFERITQTPFPLSLIKEAIEKKAPLEWRVRFEEYEKKILASPLQFLSEDELEKRRGRIADKLVKIIKGLGLLFGFDSRDTYAVWGKMGCFQLLNIVSEKRKRQLNDLETFNFENVQFRRESKLQCDFQRLWTAISLEGHLDKEVIVFHSVLAGAFLAAERSEPEIIPINPSKKYNVEMGLLLKKGHILSWAEEPLCEYENELVELIKTLCQFSRLPADFLQDSMDIESYGFDRNKLLTVKMNYRDVPYHVYILHDFLFKACKNNVSDYIRLVKVSGLDKAPMGKEVGRAFMAYLEADEKRVKLAANAADATEHDYNKYWKDPFQRIVEFEKQKTITEISKVSENYLKVAFGCYPFEGVLEFLFAQ